MYVYAVRASLGDDVYDEPCTKLLEHHMAKLTGKEGLYFEGPAICFDEENLVMEGIKQGKVKDGHVVIIR